MSVLLRQQHWPWAQTANKVTEHNELYPAPTDAWASSVEGVPLIWWSQVMREEERCSCANYLALDKSSPLGSLQFSFAGHAIPILW